MSEYLGIIKDNIDNIISKYPITKTTRIDKYLMRYYSIKDKTSFHYDIYLSQFNQSNERKESNKMGLQSKINQSKNTSIAAKFAALKGNKPMNQSNIDLSLNKFAKIESMERTINQQSKVIDNLFEKVNVLIEDNVSLINQINQINKFNSENNQLLTNIAATLTKMNSNQQVITKKSNQSNQSANQSNDNGSLYSRFLSRFKFMGSKQPVFSAEFNELCNAIDYTDFQSVDKSIRRFWTNKRESDNTFLWAPKLQNEVIKFFYSNQSNQSQSANEVKSKSYWIDYYGIDRSELQEIIDVIQENEVNGELKTMIATHINEIATTNSGKQVPQFIEWLSAWKV